MILTRPAFESAKIQKGPFPIVDGQQIEDSKNLASIFKRPSPSSFDSQPRPSLFTSTVKQKYIFNPPPPLEYTSQWLNSLLDLYFDKPVLPETFEIFQYRAICSTAHILDQHGVEKNR
jgi:hypothetical protein